MAYERVADLALDEDGDLLIENGDLALSEDQQCLADDIRVRLLSNSPELGVDQGCCANLDRFVGKSNTRSVAEEVIGSISKSLTLDGRLSAYDLELIPLPAQNTLYVNIAAGLPERRLNLLLDMDFRSGLQSLEKL